MNDLRYFVCPACRGLNRVSAERLGAEPRCGRCQQPLDLHAEPVTVSDEQLARLVRTSPVPVLVDFYADWCGPCRALAPTLAEVARAHAGRLVVAKVDTEKHPQHAAQLGIQGIPAVYLYKGGQVVAEAAGVRPRQAWEQMVAPHLGGAAR